MREPFFIVDAETPAIAGQQQGGGTMSLWRMAIEMKKPRTF